MITPLPAPLPLPTGAARALSGTYFRAVNTRFVTTAVSTAHTATVASRLSDGMGGYRLLYLAEDHFTTLLEVQALLGSPWSPGGMLSSPYGSWTLVPVTFSLRSVLDLTDPATQSALGTSYQELTGDWRGYTLRPLYAPGTFGVGSTPPAPTQALGAHLGVALPKSGQTFDGLISVSAKVPYRRNVVIFPDHLSATGGSYSYIDPITGDLVSVS